MQVKKLQLAIQNAKKITLISHVTPDGDALGSQLAFYIALKKMSKNVKLFNATDVLARRYDFLPHFHKIKSTFPINSDLVIAFDCGSFDRLGIKKGDYTLVNIDHHKSNQHYADINIVEEKYASASSVVFSVLQSLSIKIDKDIATCIYTALAEDTNFFTNNVDASVFDLASRLVVLGADANTIAMNIKQRDSLAKIRLQARFIDTITLIKDGRIAIGEVTQEMFQATGALRYDTTEFVELLLALQIVEVAIFVLELPDGGYKFSLRSKEKDLSKLASQLGGGGHHHAAGLSVKREKKETILQHIIDEVSI